MTSALHDFAEMHFFEVSLAKVFRPQVTWVHVVRPEMVVSFNRRPVVTDEFNNSAVLQGHATELVRLARGRIGVNDRYVVGVAIRQGPIVRPPFPACV